MNLSGLPPPKPIMLKERVSLLFLQYGELDVIDGSFVLVDSKGVRTHIPVGSIACLMLEPGTRVSHAAAVLTARVTKPSAMFPARSGMNRTFFRFGESVPSIESRPSANNNIIFSSFVRLWVHDGEENMEEEKTNPSHPLRRCSGQA
jgi:hypothetical protein